MTKLLKLYVPFSDKELEFRIFDESNRPMLSEGLLCREEGCETSREPFSDVVTLEGPNGDKVEVVMSHDCGYVPIQGTSCAAAPFIVGVGRLATAGLLLLLRRALNASVTRLRTLRGSGRCRHQRPHHRRQTNRRGRLCHLLQKCRRHRRRTRRPRRLG